MSCCFIKDFEQQSSNTPPLCGGDFLLRPDNFGGCAAYKYHFAISHYA
jgi:hypothetical protein